MVTHSRFYFISVHRQRGIYERNHRRQVRREHSLFRFLSHHEERVGYFDGGIDRLQYPVALLVYKPYSTATVILHDAKAMMEYKSVHSILVRDVRIEGHLT